MSASDFKARSGRTVTLREDGSLSFDRGNGYLSPQSVMDAEEYLLAKRDAELGRWRDPLDPNVVVYENAVGVAFVFDEEAGDYASFTRSEVHEIAGLAYRQVARRYFEAHPEPKPWHDAKPGEVWAVTETNGEALYRVNAWGRFEQVSGDNDLLSFPISHVSITAARRIWPEDAS